MSEQQEELPIKGPGQLLKEARERANLSLQDIADKVRLKKSLIQDIEHDIYDPIISLTFLKGYIKLYAKQVQVEEADVMAAFDNLNTQNKEPVRVKSFSRRVANQANDDKLMLVTYLIVAVVIALVVIWWFQQDRDLTELAPSLPNVQEEADNLSEKQVYDVVDTVSDVKIEDEFSPVSEPTNDVIESTLVVDDIVSDDILDTVSEQVVVGTQDIINLAIESTEPVELIFEFAADCWMNLADATGENIAYGVKVKGRVMPVTGLPPFVVTLGASEGVKISYEGEPVDLSFLTPGSTAKFTLPLSE